MTTADAFLIVYGLLGSLGFFIVGCAVCLVRQLPPCRRNTWM